MHLGADSKTYYCGQDCGPRGTPCDHCRSARVSASCHGMSLGQSESRRQLQSRQNSKGVGVIDITGVDNGDDDEDDSGGAAADADDDEVDTLTNASTTAAAQAPTKAGYKVTIHTFPGGRHPENPRKLLRVIEKADNYYRSKELSDSYIAMSETKLFTSDGIRIYQFSSRQEVLKTYGRSQLSKWEVQALADVKQWYAHLPTKDWPADSWVITEEEWDLARREEREPKAVPLELVKLSEPADLDDDIDGEKPQDEEKDGAKEGEKDEEKEGEKDGEKDEEKDEEEDEEKEGEDEDTRGGDQRDMSIDSDSISGGCFQGVEAETAGGKWRASVQ